jgi:DNA-binding response OmpR family regulator
MVEQSGRDLPAGSIRALIVDDDPGFHSFVEIALEEAGMHCRVAESAEHALELLELVPAGTYDVILLDVEMPGASGWELLERLRSEGDEVPVIYVSARGTTADRVRGLRLGADDYLAKPVEFDELIARIEAVVRRRRSLSPIVFGDLTIDLARRRAERVGKRVELTPKEFDLLLTLVRADETVLSRQDLLREVWDMEFDPGTALLDVHLGRLRKKLDRFGRPLIETVKGEGYRAVRRAGETTA